MNTYAIMIICTLAFGYIVSLATQAWLFCRVNRLRKELNTSERMRRVFEGYANSLEVENEELEEKLTVLRDAVDDYY